jgi:hypothetical protein
MKICIYSSKGGEGKTPIATNIVLDREYALGTNEKFHIFDSMLDDDMFLAIDGGEPFPNIPEDIDIVFDLAGSISSNEKSIASAINQSDLIIVPISNEVKALTAGIHTIREIQKLTKKPILVIGTKLDKQRKEKFNKNEWEFSKDFENIVNQVHEYCGDIACLPLKKSKAFDAIFEKEMSIEDLVNNDPLAKHNYAEVCLQFKQIYNFIDKVEEHGKEKQSEH